MPDHHTAETREFQGKIGRGRDFTPDVPLSADEFRPFGQYGLAWRRASSEFTWNPVGPRAKLDRMKAAAERIQWPVTPWKLLGKVNEQMSIQTYWNQKVPHRDSVLWRFMDLRKFRDMMASEELYFRRADLFTDKSEGLPPEDYALRVLGLDPFNIGHRRELNNHLGSLAQHRESYYVSCWYLYAQGLETLDMWELYGHDGVAVVTRYDLLYEALNGLLDEAHLGEIQYGTDHLTNRFNALEFITTKQKKYALDCEVRALITAYDPLASGNRHIDLDNYPLPHPLPVNPRNAWVPDCKRRRIDLRKLVIDVVISPWAEPDAAEEISLWVKLKGFPASARQSEPTGGSTPTLGEFRQYRHLFSTRPDEVGVAQESEATERELQRFAEVISTLPDDRVRWLYKKRWDVIRLNPGEIPLLSDAQYLEATLRILDARKKRKTAAGQS